MIILTILELNLDLFFSKPFIFMEQVKFLERKKNSYINKIFQNAKACQQSKNTKRKLKQNKSSEQYTPTEQTQHHHNKKDITLLATSLNIHTRGCLHHSFKS